MTLTVTAPAPEGDVPVQLVLHDAMYPPIFVDPDRPISEVLRDFRRSRRPMAIVRDAQDQVLGMITLEDIIEEIVGEIDVNDGM